ncbi:MULTISPECIES: AarF/UbiB family protein [unclassified Lysobacter]|uniref:ABC1 kinase family protein n=1 Tax=unclassified Lysobacter TaxID=2635362 RepID=UPI001BEC4D3C|nr:MULTISPECIES: AarF/UbiB family protein [unclassified Lysobacter]MBT2748766.1 AarF/ABC1/UbiB kinase family protein [Lysobacter sp. ISL-42]MBT2751701.1 AarF/ABC1/UbiB kinase family protein [Lysobacter sp. ISL-50]MBT2775895.1 AarF/ABC1/UbiB kinase family protein [Lysobacter sp. ISL-54]MBT2782141.1 AarF/ABC1/UbiB kinase family protein [Lysobacter sp. ISL-52]
MSATSHPLTRTAQVVGFFLKYRSSGVFTGLDWDQATDEDIPIPEEGKPADFVRDLEALGPTFIKIGQALSTRPDMVPPTYLAALERMQDEVTAVDAATIEAVIETELGVRLHAVFPEFDPNPLGCASLGQVHRAVLRDGREVAVKVQRPNVAQEIRNDLDTLQMLASTADHNTQVGRRLHFSDWVQEFRKALLDELDYRLEADHLERFGHHLAKYPTLMVPQPLRDLCGARVLTMQLVKGCKVTEPLGLRRTEHNLRPIVIDLLRGYLDQMFVHGELHADPHPGNLLLTPDHRLAIFDLGMVAHIPPKLRGRLLKLVFAAVDGRGESVADELIALGVRLEDFDEGRFVREVGQHIARYAAHSHAQAWSEGRLLLHLSRLSALCGLRTPPEFNLLAKTLLNLETVCVALDPDLSVKAAVEDHLQKLLRDRLLQSLSPSNLATEAIDLQSLLQEAPRKVGNVLSLLAENRLQVRITGWQDSALMENLQKIANRIAAGIVIAALLISSTMLLRSGIGPFLFGYPAFALVLFLIAAGLGLTMVVSALRNDKKPGPREERGTRS